MPRRLVSLLVLALLVLPAGSASGTIPKVRASATDAAAMKAVVSVARKIEACRATTIDYTSCDTPPPPARGVLIEAASPQTYLLSARSRPGRRFKLARGMDGSLAATCTPAGRGACPRSGVWKPKPRPVMTPAYGTEWLPNERAVVAHLELLIAAVDRCGAGTGTRVGCASEPDVTAARAALHAVTWDRVELELGEHGHYVHATAGSGTIFVFSWTPGGGGLRECQKYLPHYVSPCVDGRW